MNFFALQFVQWIHGQEGNPLFEIARDNNLIKECHVEIANKSSTSPMPVDQNIAKMEIVPKSNLIFIKQNYYFNYRRF